jgi:hypothetical protein
MGSTSFNLLASTLEMILYNTLQRHIGSNSVTRGIFNFGNKGYIFGIYVLIQLF